MWNSVLPFNKTKTKIGQLSLKQSQRLLVLAANDVKLRFQTEEYIQCLSPYVGKAITIWTVI